MMRKRSPEAKHIVDKFYTKIDKFSDVPIKTFRVKYGLITSILDNLYRVRWKFLLTYRTL